MRGAPGVARLAGLAVVHVKARDVGGRGVGRELHALAVQVQAAGECERECGLTGARNILK